MAWLGRTATGSAFDEHVRVPLDVEPECPRKLMCEKCAGPIRRSQSSSIPTPSRWSRATTSSMRFVFQASTMWVSSAWAPEMAAIASDGGHAQGPPGRHEWPRCSAARCSGSPTAAEPSRWMACAADPLSARIEAVRRTRSPHPLSIALLDTRRTVTPSRRSGTGQPLGTNSFRSRRSRSRCRGKAAHRGWVCRRPCRQRIVAFLSLDARA